MKIRIYPKKEVVMAQLSKRSDDLEADLARASAEYEKHSSSPLYVAANINSAKVLMLVTEDELNEVNRKIVLLASHEPPECMAEIDI